MAFNFRHHIPQIQNINVGVGIHNPPNVPSKSLINAEVTPMAEVHGYIYSPGDKILVKKKQDSK